jgi:hypothetical protein
LSKNRNDTVTLVLPVMEEPEVVYKFIEGNKDILKKFPLLVLDLKGGEPLKEYAFFYKKTRCPTIGMPLGSSRRFLIRRVQTEFTLNLDVDVLLPKNFVTKALTRFADSKVAAVALDYENSQGHLAFGPSLWRTKILQELYNWEIWKTKECECIYMWKKAHQANYKIKTLNMRAKHLKSLGEIIKQRKQGLSNCGWNILSLLYNHTKIWIRQGYELTHRKKRNNRP